MAHSTSVQANHGDKGKRITILSIDGGGVKGIIPATQLQFLEKQLQAIDGMDARIADYFDVIVGTSTGGLIATMLSMPNESGNPLLSAEDITNFYINYSKEVFPPKMHGLLGSMEQLVAMLQGPKYSADGLEAILLETMKDIRLSDTLTELLIPSFDIKLMQPTFFSTSQAQEDELSNPYLRDVCRGTSAAPTYLPPHFFQIHDSSKDQVREFNLVDGALVENNPTYLAIIHVLKEKFKGNKRFCGRMQDKDYRSLLVLSLGTGTLSESYTAREASSWGVLKWVYQDGKVPIVDMCLAGSADMVDFNLSVVFQTLEAPDNYLRIQATNLSKEESAVDNASDENLQNLLRAGTSLLDEPVTSVDVVSGQYIPQPNQGSNANALTRFAKELARENHARRMDAQQIF